MRCHEPAPSTRARETSRHIRVSSSPAEDVPKALPRVPEMPLEFATGTDEPQYLSGARLVAVTASATTAVFFMMDDNSIVSTAVSCASSFD